MTLGLDLSGGHARAVVVDEHGQVLARGEHEVAGGSQATAAAEALRQARGQTLNVTVTPGHITRSAVAVPCPGDALPAGVEAVLRDLLPTAPAPDVVASGVAMVVAEHWCGAAQGLSTVVALAAGERVVSGIMLDGRVWAGAHDLAGSVSWLSLNPVDRDDYRRLGGLEADVSAGGIVRRVVWRIKAGDHSAVVRPHHGDLSRIAADQVFECARTGDGLCVSVVRDTAKYVGMAVSNLAAILDPEAIVLGGLIATFGDLLLEPIRQECARRLNPAQLDHLRIALSPLGPDAAAIGAARLARSPA